MTALSDLKVLDLTRLLPGPFASLVLADLGAQVDKLEDTGMGDYMRHTAVPMAGGMSVGFQGLNRGKRSLALDLKHPAGVAAFKRLVKRYDVVFEQFRPGVMARLGLSHESLLEENPSLVICALTGYGQNGPLRDRAGHDLNYLGRSGLLGLMGPLGGPPVPPSFQLADVSGGMWCIIAILAALRERDRTGEGKLIDIGMLESVIPFAAVALGRLLGGELPERGNELLTGGVAPYNTYLTKDGESVTLGALEPKFLMKFCANAGLDVDMSMLMPGPHQEALKARFAEVIAGRTRAEWEAFNAEHDCCVEAVLRPDELRDDAQLAARGVFFDVEAEGGSFGQFRTPVTPRELEARPAPTQGEHTRAVLADAEFSPEEIQALIDQGAAR